MKKIPLLTAGLLLLAVNGLLLSGTSPVADLTPVLNLGLGLLVLLLALAPAASAPVPEHAETPAPVLPPPPSRDERTRHELAAFLGMLQEKGRLVDFVLEDITAQSDARIGQVARIVHAGCRDVIVKAFAPEPAEAAPEGQPLTLNAGYAPERYRLIGAAPAEAPYRGRLLHRGWLARKVELPEFTRDPSTRPDGYLIAPAELELS